MSKRRPTTSRRPASRPKVRPAQWSNALRRLRLATTLDGQRPATQYEIAREVGVGLNRLFMLESGRAPATPREAQALAKLFKCSVRELLIDVRKSARVAIHPLTRSR